MWDNGVLSGYDGVDIRSAMKHGTLAIGMLGMAETLQILIGKNQLDPYGMEVAKEICQLYKDRCEEFKNETSLNFGVYFTPAENLCFTAMTKFKEKYGEIPNVSDKKFFTNSVHVPVWEEVTPFEKIDVESQLDSYSSAGCILYTEFDATVKHNLDALETVVNYAMDHDVWFHFITTLICRKRLFMVTVLPSSCSFRIIRRSLMWLRNWMRRSVESEGLEVRE